MLSSHRDHQSSISILPLEKNLKKSSPLWGKNLPATGRDSGEEMICQSTSIVVIIVGGSLNSS
jgi:hypothetical protein